MLYSKSWRTHEWPAAVTLHWESLLLLRRPRRPQRYQRRLRPLRGRRAK